jgi:hypothetical protein
MDAAHKAQYAAEYSPARCQGEHSAEAALGVARLVTAAVAAGRPAVPAQVPASLQPCLLLPWAWLPLDGPCTRQPVTHVHAQQLACGKDVQLWPHTFTKHKADFDPDLAAAVPSCRPALC